MREPILPTTAANVAWTMLLAFQVALSIIGCSRDDHPSNFQTRSSTPRPVTANCDRPNAGCSCESPGALVDCGEVREKVGDYLSCTQGVRRCGEDKVWGACEGDLVKVPDPARTTTSLLAMGSVESCVGSNPCDPLCRQFVDTGIDYPALPEGLCSTERGVELCALCGYDGAVSQLSYSAMPLEWRRIPETCTPTDDRCPFDMVCVGSTCRSRVAPCRATNTACGVDLTLGKPCFDPANPKATFHVPVCNRGTVALRNANIRIGVDSRSSNLTACLPNTDAQTSDGFPNRGYIEYALTGDAAIEPGTCIDVRAETAVASANLYLGGANALLVNFDGSIAECNRCNNGSVTIASGDVSTSSRCADCIGPGCGARDTTLRGVVYDPAGNNPVPNSIVYVSNGALPSFGDGVAVERCENAVPANVRVWTTTDATGHFSLRGIPAGDSFDLVVQLGRWRRQYRVAPVPAGQTRWVAHYSDGLGRLELTADATEPTPDPTPSRRMRLPATHQRCDATSCSGEGEMPRIAVLLGDGDPLECALRRIGIADSEFTSSNSTGRVHLYRANGMYASGATPAFGSDGLLLGTGAANNPRLFDYAMLIAPCNGEHGRIGNADFITSPYASGPSYNGWPDPTTNEAERATVRSFVEAGGRLITSHWLAVDFVHLNYDPPARANIAGTAAAVSLVSPYDPSSDTAWATAVANYASTVPGFGLEYQSSDTYQPTAPALFLFGNAIHAGGSLLDAASSGASGSYPALTYSIPTNSPDGQSFADWAGALGDTELSWRQWSPMVSRVRAANGAVALLTSNSTDASRFGSGGTNPVPLSRRPCLEGDGSSFDCDRGHAWGDEHVGMYRIDAPPDATNKLGRIGVITGHASQHECHSPSNARASKYCGNGPPFSPTNPAPDCDCHQFPRDAVAACGATASPSTEERAFEYLLFNTAQCLGTVPLQPALPRLTSSGFFRDFESDCAFGEQPIWRLFSWQATVPTGTSIDFFAATADTKEGLESAEYLQIGFANSSTTTWTASGHTVDEYLRDYLTPPEKSRKWLRVWSVLRPNAGATPELTAWRAVFNCVSNE